MPANEKDAADLTAAADSAASRPAKMEGPGRTPSSDRLAPPIVTSLRAGLMERSFSEDIREEREELREAAEQTLNVIMDLNLDGTIRWVSPSWIDVIGTLPESVEGLPVSDLIVSDNKTVFTDVIEAMQKDDSRSRFIRFAAALGPLSRLLPVDNIADTAETDESAETAVIDLEAQGIMVYDSASDGETRTMWMVRPWMAPREVKIDLPRLIVDSLGSGAEVLASYLTQLAESGMDDPASYPPPSDVLCRICERNIPSWWFEKHTDLCLQEHRAEMDLQMAHESLTEHRHAIVKVLDALEARTSRSLIGDAPNLPSAEYKGLSIGPPPPSSSSNSSSATSSPAPGVASGRSRERAFGHARARSFAVRRPQARIVELLMDLCDTAIEISTPAIKESSQNPGDFRTQSPQSEGRIAQVMQWETPGTNTLEQEQGLALLCTDTERLAKAKVEAIFRYRKIIEYAERIRIEFAILVKDCIDEAMFKAAEIAAGRLSVSASEDEDEDDEDVEQVLVQAETEYEEEVEQPLDRPEEEDDENNDDNKNSNKPPGPGQTPAVDESVPTPPEEGIFPASFENPSSLITLALERVHLGDGDSGRRSVCRTIASTRSSSPKECPTPRSHRGALQVLTGQSQSRRESLIFESDPADNSDSSMRSASVTSRPPPRTESPISEFGDLRRQASSRQHHRRSLILPGAVSPRRQESPSRMGQPASPLRIHKPRGLPFPSEGVISPEASPMLPAREFASPNVIHHSLAQHHLHHRRQSSAAVSASTGEISIRPPPSPRLSAVVSAPQAKAVPPSIKDFEIIKPISKGAFGSVYLSKKKTTGEYFAIKVLKKADMVAKNQVTNVKAERAIMMWQGESDFVAKLYWTFSSKDYLYLVMEYLNGGDCASLIKILGGLPEDWAKKYLGEVILGVEHLHSRGIVHRDLKPDNLLIDQKGHLKLTDFGLSRMGLIGRQKRALNGGADSGPDLLKQGPFARSASMASSRSASMDLHGRHQSPASTPQMTPSDMGAGPVQPSYFILGSSAQDSRRLSTQRSDSGGSEAMTQMFGNFSLGDPPPPGPAEAVQSPGEPNNEAADVGHGSPDLVSLSHTTTRSSTEGRRGTPPQSGMPPPNWALFDPEDTNRRFVGTPDYLAPETIRGEPQDETSDWWSVGCILFEFLFGIPPFNASEAEQVFENILARRIQWPDESEEYVSPEARDLINRLLCSDPHQRLGSNREDRFRSGGEEIRKHAWFDGMNWDSLLQDEAQFVPQPENPEDTEYFDSRGATLQAFTEEMEDQSSAASSATPDYQDRPHDALSRVRTQVNSMKRGLMPLHIPPHVRDLKSRRLSEPAVADDFGNFAYKNLPVLDKANKDVIQKLRAEALATHGKPISPTVSGVTSPGQAGLEGSPIFSLPVQRNISNTKVAAAQRPQSPSAASHSNSSPSRVSQPSSPLLVSFVAGQGAEGRRKASSTSSSLSQPTGTSSSLQPGSVFDVPRVPPSLQKAATTIAASSPVKGRSAFPPLPLSPSKAPATQLVSTPRHVSGGSSVGGGGRSRSLTVGSQESSPVASDALLAQHKNRRSQVFDMSPSSSDNEGDKATSALLRVQRRRQGSRRMSGIGSALSSEYRPLDVLICEDHPVSRMVMEKLLEKVRCRTISASTGSEAVRYSMSEIQFDIIFMEFKLPQINGADVARMIRETKNANSHTPLVAITAYLKELQAPHYFDSLVEKPISSSKLTEVLCKLCQWKPALPGQVINMTSGGSHYVMPIPVPHPIPSGLRQAESLRHPEESPTTTTSGSSVLGGFALRSSSSFREDSIGSSLFGDTESVTTQEDCMSGFSVPGVVISRKATGESIAGVGPLGEEPDQSQSCPPGLGISGAGKEEEIMMQAFSGGAGGAAPGPADALKSPATAQPPPHLVTQQSAPAQMMEPPAPQPPQLPQARSRSPVHIKLPNSSPQQSLEKLKARRESIIERKLQHQRSKLEGDMGSGSGSASGSFDSADDEDEELGSGAAARSNSGNGGSSAGGGGIIRHYRSKSSLPSSKLGIEMMRANSHDSITNQPTSAASDASSGSTTIYSTTRTPYLGNSEAAASRPSRASDSGAQADPAKATKATEEDVTILVEETQISPPQQMSPLTHETSIPEEEEEEEEEEEGDTTVIITPPPEQEKDIDSEVSGTDVSETPRPSSALEHKDVAMGSGGDNDPTPRPPKVDRAGVAEDELPTSI